MASRISSKDWLKENSGGSAKRRLSSRSKTTLSKHLCKQAATVTTVKAFVEEVRSSHKGNDCIFVPGAIEGRPATVSFCGRTISAARYMALLCLGTPKHDGIEARHLCGNGHLSCVHPEHVVWGSREENISDMVKHRAAETVQDRINAVSGRL